MANDIEISVAIPVYGSASILPELAAQLESALSAQVGAGAFEVVLVNDCGPDDAWQVIVDLAESRPWLRGIDLRKNVGQHNALMAALRVCRGRYLVTMDDDLQHSPSDIAPVVAALRDGADLCYVEFASRQHVLWKRFGSHFNDLVAQRLLNKPKGLYLSPFRGFTAAIRDDVVRYEGPFVYLDGLLLQNTDNIRSVQGIHHVRLDGRSGYSLRKSISLWLKMATSFSVAPLRLVSFAGMLAAALAFAMALVVFVEKLLTPDMPVGWPSLIITILFMGGLQLLALGAIGEYTGRILLTVNGRPQFVMGRTVNLDSPQV